MTQAEASLSIGDLPESRKPHPRFTSQDIHRKIGNLLNQLYEQRRVAELYGGIATKTKACEQHPNDNQDALVSDPSIGLFGVFDGLGGHPGGRWASSYAVIRSKQLIEAIRSQSKTISEQEIFEILGTIDDELYEAGQGWSKLTTAVLLVEKSLKPAEDREMIIAKSGDSRAYLLRNNELFPLTLDHSGIGSYAHPLDIDPKVDQQERLVQAQLAEADSCYELIDTDPTLRLPYQFLHRNIVSGCLGSNTTAEVSTTTLSAQKGDLVVLTTDGIHDNLKDSQIKDILVATMSQGTDVITKALVEKALEISRLDHDEDTERAKPDDMTVVIVAL